jgi:hypothetical protein
MTIRVPEALSEFVTVGFTPVQGSGWPEGDAIIEGVHAEAGLQQLMATLRRLELEIAAMPIASRFSTTRSPQGLEIGCVIDPDLPEAEFKRSQLLADLQLVRGTFLTAYSRLASLVLDKEATSREF